jgi:hypothetical protein
MTPTISPVAGTLSPLPSAAQACATAPPPLTQAQPQAAATSMPASAVGVSPATTVVAGTAGGGAVQAMQGAAQATPEQLIEALKTLTADLEKLVASIRAQNGVVGGGGAAGCGCGMPGCTHGAGMSSAQGAMAGPTASPAPATTPAPATSGGGDAHGHSHAADGGGAPAPAPAPAAGAGTVDPSTVKDKTGTGGLSAAPKRGLEVAHTFGLPLVSGHRPGGPSSSDHTHGNAIDVGTLPIGAASSTEGTPQMKAYAEHMRQAGKRGELGVKYVILDGKIASSRENWEWRTYTYPGKSAAEMEAMKSSNRGEYNRMQHHDHVHVSFN